VKNCNRTLDRTRRCSTTASGPSHHQRVWSSRRQFSWTSDWTLDRMRRYDHCVRSWTSPSRPITRDGFPGGPLTGLYPRPVNSNRTCPVALGAYWTLTGCLCSASGQAISTSGHPMKNGSEPFFLIVHHFFLRLLPHRAPPLSLLPCPNPSQPARHRHPPCPRNHVPRRYSSTARASPRLPTAAAPPPLFLYRRCSRTAVAPPPNSCATSFPPSSPAP
jgi:hypothetical protein